MARTKTKVTKKTEKANQQILTLGDIIGQTRTEAQDMRKGIVPRTRVNVDDTMKTFNEYENMIRKYVSESTESLEDIGAKITGYNQFTILEKGMKYIGDRVWSKLTNKAYQNRGARIAKLKINESLQVVMDNTRAYYQTVQRIITQMDQAKGDVEQTLVDTTNGLKDATSIVKEKNPIYETKLEQLTGLKTAIQTETDPTEQVNLQAQIDGLEKETQDLNLELTRQAEYKKSAVENHEYAEALSKLLVTYQKNYKILEAELDGVIRYAAKNIGALGTVLASQKAFFVGSQIKGGFQKVMDTGLQLAGQGATAMTQETVEGFTKDFYDRQSIKNVLEQTIKDQQYIDQELRVFIKQAEKSE